MLTLVLLMVVFFVAWAVAQGLQGIDVKVPQWVVGVSFFALVACIVLILAGKEAVFQD
jgi:hypothetical protein